MIPEVHKLDKETLISKLAEFFKSQEDVELAYLFGSTAEDNRGPLLKKITKCVLQLKVSIADSSYF